MVEREREKREKRKERGNEFVIFQDEMGNMNGV